MGKDNDEEEEEEEEKEDLDGSCSWFLFSLSLPDVVGRSQLSRWASSKVPASR
jgi:hypothetical protein